MQNQHRLDDLLARNIVPQWFEGVALVQLTCRQLRGQRGESAGFPRSSDLRIGPGGSIAIAGEADGNAVQAAAHVLALMLSDDGPVRLRLVVSQATASESGYASLAEFSEALSYFERPNPESIVAAFRERALAAAPREMQPAPRVDAPPLREKHPAPAPPPPRQPVNRMAVAAVTIAALACASVWLVGRGVTGVASPTLVMADDEEAAAPPKRAQAGKALESAARERKVARAESATSRAPQAPRSAAAVAPERPAQLQAFAEAASYRYFAPVPPGLDAPFAGSNPVEPAVTDNNAGTADVGGDSGDRIYSRADAQVTLPQNVYPKFPAETPEMQAAGLTVLELTIATDGLVERVRMLTAPRNIHEFMLLSAAKAWRFEPARLDGRPVRFRHTIALTRMP